MLSFSGASTLRIRRGELTDALIACPSGGPVPALNLDRPAIRACLGPDFHRPAPVLEMVGSADVPCGPGHASSRQKRTRERSCSAAASTPPEAGPTHFVEGLLTL